MLKIQFHTSMLLEKAKGQLLLAGSDQKDLVSSLEHFPKIEEEKQF